MNEDKGNRETAIQRDNESCVVCGITRTEHYTKYGRDITVDHIDGRGSHTPYALRNSELSNLQTLCSECHGRKDNKYRKLTTEDGLDIRMFHSKGMKGRGNTQGKMDSIKELWQRAMDAEDYNLAQNLVSQWDTLSIKLQGEMETEAKARE